MSEIVLDCSIAVSWCFEDEARPETDAILDVVKDQGAIVPGLWHLEVANVFLQARKKGRMKATDIQPRLELLAKLPIKIDNETYLRAFGDIVQIADKESLTAYDAAYLELAIRTKLPLATKDKELASAANRAGVKVLPINL